MPHASGNPWKAAQCTHRASFWVPVLCEVRQPWATRTGASVGLPGESAPRPLFPGSQRDRKRDASLENVFALLGVTYPLKGVQLHQVVTVLFQDVIFLLLFSQKYFISQLHFNYKMYRQADEVRKKLVLVIFKN